jgi:hypothetical protein
MANKHPNPEYQFKPGNDKAKGKGRPPIPTAIKEARELNKEESFKIVQKYAWMPKEEIISLVKNTLEFNKLPLYEQGILTSFLKYSTSGDLSIIQFWADHLVGTPKTTIDLNNRISGSLSINALRQSEEKCKQQPKDKKK